MVRADVLTLGMAADEARREALKTNVVTYQRVYEITDGTVLTSAVDVPERASEVRLYATPATFDEALLQVRALKQASGRRRLTAFSWVDVDARGWTDRIGELVEAGLDDLAELPVDRTPDLGEALRVLTGAGLEPKRLTISHPIGDQREEILERVQRAFSSSPSLRRFSPLPRIAPVDKPTTGYEDVRMVALARLALPDRSIEVDWKLYGPKLAQVALAFGADHLDAVSPVDDVALGPRRATAEEVERNVRAAGFEARELIA
jgi:aminodeoxyfutalosine synthase